MKYAKQFITYISSSTPKTIGLLIIVILFGLGTTVLISPATIPNTNQRIASDFIGIPLSEPGEVRPLEANPKPTEAFETKRPDDGGIKLPDDREIKGPDGFEPLKPANPTSQPNPTTIPQPPPNCGKITCLPGNLCSIDVCPPPSNPIPTSAATPTLAANVSPTRSQTTPSPSVTSSVTPTGTLSVTPTGHATTTTPVPTSGNGQTLVHLDIVLPGIGSTRGAGSNQNPANKTRPFTLGVFDKEGLLVKEISGPLTFNGSSYTGDIALAGVPAGSYTFKVKSDNSIYKAVMGVKNVTNGNVASATPQVVLVTGNMTGPESSRNILDAFDYNALLSCIAKSSSCSSDLQQKADLNDDGLLDSKDFNILLRGFATRRGD